MNARFFGFVGIFGILGCISTYEGVRRPWEVQIPLSAPASAMVPAEMVEAPEPATPIVEECLARGRERLPDVYATVLLPTYDLAGMTLLQHDLEIHLHEKVFSDGDAPPYFELGPIIGQVIVTNPNKATLEAMNDGTKSMNDGVRREGFEWRLGWKQLGPGTYATNDVAWQVSRKRFDISLTEKLDFTSDFANVEHEDLRGLTINLSMESPSVFTRLLMPDYGGQITFKPHALGLVRKGKLVACVPARAAYEKQ